MFAPIVDALVLRVVQSQGFSRCCGTFAPLHKEGTVLCIGRKLRKLGWPIARERVAWAYDVLGGATSGVESTACHNAN